MTREECIKLRDRAANAMELCVSIVAVDHTMTATDRDAGLFWCAVHEVAVRELACMPQVEESLFDAAKVLNAIDEIQLWSNGEQTAAKALSNIDMLLRSAMAKDGAA